MEYIIIIVFIAIIATIIVVAINSSKKPNLQNYVKATSGMYMELLQLNNNQKFFSTKNKTINFYIQCNSKKALEEFDFDKYLMFMIETNEYNAQTYLEQIIQNNINYAKYIKDCTELQKKYEKHLPYGIQFDPKIYKNIETSLFKQAIISPQLEINFVLIPYHKTRSGQINYQSSVKYNYQNLLFYKNKLNDLTAKKAAYKIQIEAERSKMTTSMRFNVLKRDNYRCKICGATADDGVKLHIDHIVPVSKGGKT